MESVEFNKNCVLHVIGMNSVMKKVKIGKKNYILARF